MGKNEFTIKMYEADINRLKYFRYGIAKFSNIKDGLCTATFEVISISKGEDCVTLEINEDESYSIPEGAYKYIKIKSERIKVWKKEKRLRKA